MAKPKIKFKDKKKEVIVTITLSIPMKQIKKQKPSEMFEFVQTDVMANIDEGPEFIATAIEEHLVDLVEDIEEDDMLPHPSV